MKIEYKVENNKYLNIKQLLKEYYLMSDRLILKLSKTELLKVQLHEKTGGVESWPTSSILLESNNDNGRVHISQQYNVLNTELEEEQKVLNKTLKKIKTSKK